MSSKKKSNHEVYQERVLYDQNFNVLLNMQMLQMAKKQNSATGLSVDQNFPWAHFAPLDLKGKPKTSDPFTDANYAVHIDVHHFRVSEIEITIKKRKCYIKGNHGPRDDEHGSVARSFTRYFQLPENIDPGKLKTIISSDGVLTIYGAYEDGPITDHPDNSSTTLSSNDTSAATVASPVAVRSDSSPSSKS